MSNPSRGVQYTEEELERRRANLQAGRAKFYEMLTLLNGGALVLSVSFLGFISTKTAHVVHARVLYAAWACFVLSLLGSVWRNLFRGQSYWASVLADQRGMQADETGASIKAILEGRIMPVSENRVPMPPQLAAKNLSQYKELFDWAAKHADTRAKLHGGIARLCEFVAQLGFVGGVLLLLAFAVLNTRIWLASQIQRVLSP
jgi:hypothetical protein